MNRNEESLKALRDIIGPDLFQMVMDKMHGQRLYIPQYAPGYAGITERNQAMVEDFKAGMPCAEMESKYQLTEQTIRKTVRK